MEPALSSLSSMPSMKPALHSHSCRRSTKTEHHSSKPGIKPACQAGGLRSTVSSVNCELYIENNYLAKLLYRDELQYKDGKDIECEPLSKSVSKPKPVPTPLSTSKSMCSPESWSNIHAYTNKVPCESMSWSTGGLESKSKFMSGSS